MTEHPTPQDVETTDVGRVPSEPGCEATPSTACGVLAESHPSRVANFRLEAAVRMADEISENLRKQIVESAAQIARDAESPLLAGYLSGRTAELHDWATNLRAWRAIARSLSSDSDGSGEADETGTGSAEGDSAGRQASPNTSIETQEPRT